jgi:hypothetical protein
VRLHQHIPSYIVAGCYKNASKNDKEFQNCQFGGLNESEKAPTDRLITISPISTCVIGKGPLSGMGGPDYFIVGSRLVQLCCAGCRDKVTKDPLAAFAIIDAAKK